MIFHATKKCVLSYLSISTLSIAECLPFRVELIIIQFLYQLIKKSTDLILDLMIELEFKQLHLILFQSEIKGITNVRIYQY